MRGFPKTIGTKQDILNLVGLAEQDDGGIESEDLINFLDNLIATKRHYVVKAEAAEKPTEEQTPDDYELVDNPNSDMIRLGITEDEINQIKAQLEEV
jgi:hypothetical protein